MGLEAVKDEIIRNAKKQGEEIIAQAKSEKERKLKEAEQKSSELREKSEADTKKILDMMKKQELASAELESRKIILGSKKMIVDNIFMEVRRSLEKMDFRKKEDYIRKLIAKAENEIDVGKVYCSRNDVKSLKEHDAEPIDILGGIITDN